MSLSFEAVSAMIHDHSPYAGFDASAYPCDPSGFIQNENKLYDLAASVAPDLMIEVGSWKGMSANCLATVAKSLDKPSGVICVDTWLGAREFWASGTETDGWWQGLVPSEHFRQADDHYKALGLINGYPSVYYHFLANMVHLGNQNHVTPFPQTSVIAARWFKSNKVQADFVFIDGSHDMEDVFLDAKLYWDLVKPGGIMCGDDYWIDDVKKGVHVFAMKHGVEVESDFPYWIIRKSQG